MGAINDAKYTYQNRRAQWDITAQKKKMKKYLSRILLIGVFVLSFAAELLAVPNGKYEQVGYSNDYVVVSGDQIYLYISGYFAGTMYIKSEEDDGSFTFDTGGGHISNGRWYESDGNIYLILGQKKMVMVD